MAKTRRARSIITKRPPRAATVKRDPARITRRRLFYAHQVLKNNKKSNLYILPLLPVEDGRLFHPHRPLARSLSGTRALLKHYERPQARSKQQSRFTPFVGFQNPAKVITCVRRKSRKEVLHALQIRGGSGNIRKKHKNRLTYKSEIRC